MGLRTAEVEKRGGSNFGAEANRAARLHQSLGCESLGGGAVEDGVAEGEDPAVASD